VDMSSWKFRGLANFDFPPGTVLIPGDTLYVAGHLNTNGFHSRSEFPCSGEGLLAIGPLGAMNLSGDRLLTLQSRDGEVIDSKTYAGKDLGRYEQLRITELMYSPKAQSGDMSDNLDDYAWLELSNCGSQPIDLEGVKITDGIQYTFGPHLLEPGKSVVLAKNEQAFRQRYPDFNYPLFSGYSQNLGRRTDTLFLYTPEGTLIEEVTYFSHWYPVTDQGGYTLQVVDPWLEGPAMSSPENWAPSASSGGSPGIFELMIPPAILTETLSVQGGKISFQVVAPRGFTVEKSTGLQDWQPVDFELDENRVIIDDDGSGFFYRLRAK
jgi:hypothetical protein